MVLVLKMLAQEKKALKRKEEEHILVKPLSRAMCRVCVVLSGLTLPFFAIRLSFFKIKIIQAVIQFKNNTLIFCLLK